MSPLFVPSRRVLFFFLLFARKNKMRDREAFLDLRVSGSFYEEVEVVVELTLLFDVSVLKPMAALCQNRKSICDNY